MASLAPDNAVLREASLPVILSPDDLERYRRIFAAQQAGHWRDADRDIGALDDRLLVGTVLAQRYRSRTYHSSYPELLRWLERYGDLPDAKAIYALALEHHPVGAAMPPKPTAPNTNAIGVNDNEFAPRPSRTAEDARKPLPAAEERRSLALQAQIQALVDPEPRKAAVLLAGKDAKVLINSGIRDSLRSAIAESFLARGDAQAALNMSTSTETAAYAPIANWDAGLAAWRLGRFAEARSHFEALARSSGQSPWVKSAAAFWAARTELRLRHPQNYGYWLKAAAENPRTFYGLLARHILGVDRYDTFDTESFTAFDAQLLRGIEGGKRALALIELGQDQLAAAELRQIAAHASPTLLQSLAALADRANLPGFSFQLASLISDDSSSHDFAFYPVPRWEPLGGFTVDRALIYALMRQESQFAPSAHSDVGARGLMQLMPATARSMAARTGARLGARNSKSERAALDDPEYNLMLAQEYVKVLLHDPRIKDNLVLFAASYNYGPTAMARWVSEHPEYRNDPLLFIESIPSQQSRIFTLRVLTNYWIYRQRLGQPTPGLNALADGNWPIYTALDNTATQSASVAANGGQYAEN